MKPFGPFDAVGAIALEIERMMGEQQGRRDFAAGKVKEWPQEDMTPLEEARSKGYLDAWLAESVAHCRKSGVKY